MTRKTYMNGAKNKLAGWHTALRQIVTGLEVLTRKVETLDEDVQNRRVMVENYDVLMKIDIPFTQKFLQVAETEILVEALRGQHAVVVKLLDAIEKAKHNL